MSCKVVIASTRRKVRSGFKTSSEAKAFADAYKLEHGVNTIVVETREIYTTTTIDEAEAEARAALEAKTRMPNLDE